MPKGAGGQRWSRSCGDGLDQGVRPGGPDRLNFDKGSQPLVDAAFLAQAFLRAPSMWTGLPETTRTRLVDAFRSSRVILPGFNNWLLFAATVEAFLKRAGDPTWDRMRVDYALRQHEQWYKGDGVYGDGPQFHFDYYNAYVIQPMLVDVLDACADDRPAWQAMREPVLTRARRYAAIQERLIAPDGAFPPVGRSLAYRCGAFQGLAQAALRRDLPKDVTPGQARAALGAVIARTLDAPGTFDANGWLTLGLCGHQPGIAETYISTGSLYLCSAAFLPLGLPASDPFWTDAAARLDREARLARRTHPDRQGAVSSRRTRRRPPTGGERHACDRREVRRLRRLHLCVAPRLTRLATMRYAPGTPSGSSRNHEYAE